MTDFTYCVSPLRVSGRAAFTEASKEELRVLLLLIECDGNFGSAEELAAVKGIGKRDAEAIVAYFASKKKK